MTERKKERDSKRDRERERGRETDRQVHVAKQTLLVICKQTAIR